MSLPRHLDELLRDWPYESDGPQVRLVQGDDGRDVIQMRVDLGLMQLEVIGRPDGQRPGGAETYFDHLIAQKLFEGDAFQLSEEQCLEVDREFVQYYYRRHCWLRLQQYRRATEDADHSLNLMDFCQNCSPDEQWTMSHEQYRPFVMFDRIQSSALAALDEKGPETAVIEVNRGLDHLRKVFADHDAEEHFDDHELVARLGELRQMLLDQFDDGARLRKKLRDAIAAEEYELAARLRDELANFERKPR